MDESYFDARERRLALSLRVSEVLNSLVRPVLALIFGGALVYLVIIGGITSGEFLGMAAMVLGFFFQAREAEKAREQIKAQQAEIITLAKALPPDVSKDAS